MAPLIDSYQAAADLLELYCMALVRDIPLRTINDSSIPIPILDNIIIPRLNDPLVKNYLNAPVNGSGNITRELLFREGTTGDRVGPYISQFMYYNIQIGQFLFEQNKYICLNKVDLSGTNINFGDDFMTNVSSFIPIWNGVLVNTSISQDTRYITTPRDGALYINRDQVWQMFFFTATALLGRSVRPGFFCTPRPGSKFINLGPIDLYDLMLRAAKMAMNASWLWKWKQMRVRPEEMAYQLNQTLTNPSDPYNVSFAPTLTSNTGFGTILKTVFDICGNYLLPQAYPYGSPCHASYPAGHATYGGALSTILKAFFNCDYYMEAWQASLFSPPGTGLDIAPFPPGVTGVAFLTLEGELNKLASNCAVWRNFAGIHYRSDAEAGLAIGEEAAIITLQDAVKKYTADVAFVFRRRNGQKVVIKNYDGPDPPPTAYLNYNYSLTGDAATTIYATQPYLFTPDPMGSPSDAQILLGLPLGSATDVGTIEDPGETYFTFNQF